MKRLNANNNQPYLADQSVPLENLLDLNELVEPGRYILHPTGGFHVFRKVNYALSKYFLKEFPWIEDTQQPKRKGCKTRYHEGKRRASILAPSNGTQYAMLKIDVVDIDDSGEENILRRARPMHRIVAAAYCHNDDFNKLPITNHINFDKQDYRICNLEWSNYEQNAVGSYKNKSITSIYNTYMENNSQVKDKF